MGAHSQTIPPTQVKRIAIRPDDFAGLKDYHQLKALYTDMQTALLFPNTEVWEEDRRLVKVNSLGCKGEELLPGVPVIGCLGDSTTICIGPDSWPGRVAVPGYQVLNAGNEGHNLEMVWDWYQRLSRQVEFAALVIYTGWHNIVYGDTRPEHWREVLDRFPGEIPIFHLNVATCLIEECRQRGIEELLRPDRSGFTSWSRIYAMMDETYFTFWARMEPSRENVGQVLDGIERYNGFLADYCHQRGRVLIDLAGLMRPASYDQVPRDFFDVCHFRPRAFTKVAALVSQTLTRHLPKVAPVPVRPAAPAAQPSPAAPASHGSGRFWHRLRGKKDSSEPKIYPLW